MPHWRYRDFSRGSFSLNLITYSIYASWIQLENKAQIHIIFINEFLVWSSPVNNVDYELEENKGNLIILTFKYAFDFGPYW